MKLWPDQHNQSQLYGIVLLVLASVLWSTGGVFIKMVNWHPLAIAGGRSAFASLVIWLAFRRYPLHLNAPLLIGAVANMCTMLAFVSATKLTTAANAILLQYTAPLWVAILGSIFLKEKPKYYDWLILLIVGLSMLLFFKDQTTAEGMLGNILAIASGVFMAVLMVSMRYQKDQSPFGSVLVGNILTFFVCLPFMFEGSPGTSGWAAIATLGCFQLGSPYVLYSLAIKHITALEASIINVVEPILNPFWVLLLVGEAPGFWSLVGGGILLITITIRYAIPFFQTSTRDYT